MSKTTPQKYSTNDMVDAFVYCLEGLKVQQARREKRHRLIMFLLAVIAIGIGAIIAAVLS